MTHAAYLPLLGLMTAAAVIDWRSRLLPNTLNAVILVTGIGFSFEHLTVVSPGFAVIGAVLGLLLLLPAFVINAVGGGDVKLLAAVGAWTGPIGIFVVLILTTLAGAVVAVVQAAQSGKLRALLENSGVLAINLVHARTLGVDHLEQTGQQFRSIDRPLPYAVPMVAGVVVWLLAF